MAEFESGMSVNMTKNASALYTGVDAEELLKPYEKLAYALDKEYLGNGNSYSQALLNAWRQEAFREEVK